ncbi:hypothetical protein SESBI_50086 [Sesbania bispinosa]|nr:hypothetical protein SESBI_50086 [Sesbania bispinosa]
MEAPHRRPRPAAEQCARGAAATELRVGWRSGHGRGEGKRSRAAAWCRRL